MLVAIKFRPPRKQKQQKITVVSNWCTRNDSSNVSGVLHPDKYSATPRKLLGGKYERASNNAKGVYKKNLLSGNNCYCRYKTTIPRPLSRPKQCVYAKDWRDTEDWERRDKDEELSRTFMGGNTEPIAEAVPESTKHYNSVKSRYYNTGYRVETDSGSSSLDSLQRKDYEAFKEWQKAMQQRKLYRHFEEIPEDIQQEEYYGNLGEWQDTFQPSIDYDTFKKRQKKLQQPAYYETFKQSECGIEQRKSYENFTESQVKIQQPKDYEAYNGRQEDVQQREDSKVFKERQEDYYSHINHYLNERDEDEDDDDDDNSAYQTIISNVESI